MCRCICQYIKYIWVGVSYNILKNEGRNKKNSTTQGIEMTDMVVFVVWGQKSLVMARKGVQKSNTEFCWRMFSLWMEGGGGGGGKSHIQAMFLFKGEIQ